MQWCSSQHEVSCPRHKSSTQFCVLSVTEMSTAASDYAPNFFLDTFTLLVKHDCCCCCCSFSRTCKNLIVSLVDHASVVQYFNNSLIRSYIFLCHFSVKACRVLLTSVCQQSVLRRDGRERCLARRGQRGLPAAGVCPQSKEWFRPAAGAALSPEGHPQHQPLSAQGRQGRQQISYAVRLVFHCSPVTSRHVLGSA